MSCVSCIKLPVTYRSRLLCQTDSNRKEKKREREPGAEVIPSHTGLVHEDKNESALDSIS
jgi:hypothetical protein